MSQTNVETLVDPRHLGPPGHYPSPLRKNSRKLESSYDRDSVRYVSPESPVFGGAGARESDRWEAKLRGRKMLSESKIARIEAKNEEYRELFGLPEDEALVEDFNCALQKKILLQGRMYIFPNYLCFYANVFGYIKNKAIPFKDVTSVRKAKNVGFPNSIEVIVYGKREFFTSFLSRDEAYRLIISFWSRCSGYSKIFGSNSNSSLQFSNASTPRDHPGSLPPHRGHHRQLSSQSYDDRLQAGSPEPTDSTGGGEPRGRAGSTGGVTSGESTGGGENGAAGEEVDVPRPLHASSSMPSVDGEEAAPSEMSSAVTLPHHHHAVVPPRRAYSLPEKEDPEGEGDSGGNYDEDGGDEGDVDDGHSSGGDENGIDEEEDAKLLAAERADAPPVRKDSREVLTVTLPLSVRDFISRALGDASFQRAYHDKRGDEQVTVGSWARNTFLGHVRDVQFRSPVKAGFGPKRTWCHQTQRFKVYNRGGEEGHEHLVFETSQVMADIPYGDYFRVEARWDVRAGPPAPASSSSGGAPGEFTVDSCVCCITVDVPFSKKTVWKRQIVKGVVDETKDSYDIFFALLLARVRGGGAGEEGLGMGLGSPGSPSEGESKQQQQRPGGSRQGAGGKGSKGGGRGGRQPGDVDLDLAKIPPEWREQVMGMLKLQAGGGGGDGGIEGGDAAGAALERLKTTAGGEHTHGGELLRMPCIGCQLGKAVWWLLRGGAPEHPPPGAAAAGAYNGGGRSWLLPVFLLAVMLLVLLEVWALGGMGGTSAMLGLEGPGAGGGVFWQKRMEHLQREMAFLERRMQLLVNEMDSTRQYIHAAGIPP